jgi:uncharacterized membrane protein HdeD (DUF308 family)
VDNYRAWAGVRLGNDIGGGWLLATSGVWSALFGAILIAWPNAALHGLIWLIGIGAIFFGSLLMYFGLELRRIGFELQPDDFTMTE